MKRQVFLVASVFLVLVALPSAAVSAPVSREIPLTVAIDLPFPKDYTFQFSLWDSGVQGDPAGNLIWWERKKIRVAGKTLKHLLGSVSPAGNPLDPAFFGQQLWAQVERWNAGTSSWIAVGPRSKLSLAPYAFFSETVAPGSIAADRLLDGAALAELLDDDGAGSGLDADLLDGLHAADFATAGHAHDAAYVNVGEAGSVSAGMIADGAVTKPKLSAAGGTSGQVLSTNGTTLQWATPPAGDVTGVTAGDGLTGGAASGEATLNIGAGTGITVSADAVAVDTTVVQRRITASCSDGSVRSIGSDGSVSCARETNVWHVEGAQLLSVGAVSTVVRELSVPGRTGTYVVTVSGSSWYSGSAGISMSCSITTGSTTEEGHRFHSGNFAQYHYFPFAATRAFTYTCSSYPCAIPFTRTFRLVCFGETGVSVYDTSMVVTWYE